MAGEVEHCIQDVTMRLNTVLNLDFLMFITYNKHVLEGGSYGCAGEV